MGDRGDEDNKGYVVRDRRRFDAAGDPRADEAIKTPAAEAPRTGASGSAPAGAAPRPAAPQTHAAPHHTPVREPHPDQRPGAEDVQHAAEARTRLADERVDFGSLVLSIATNAMISLQGGSPDDRIPGGRPNLAAAAQHIDILTILEEKTRGNLEPEEAELLHSVLYDLRMNYVAIAKS